MSGTPASIRREVAQNGGYAEAARKAGQKRRLAREGLRAPPAAREDPFSPPAAAAAAPTGMLNSGSQRAVRRESPARKFSRRVLRHTPDVERKNTCEPKSPLDSFHSHFVREVIAKHLVRESVKVAEPVVAEPPGPVRLAELRTRLRVLSERDQSMWGIKEMRAFLAAGGVACPDDVSKAEVLERARVLAEQVSQGISAPPMRLTELRTRLRVLSERDQSMWGIKEMRAFLAAGGEECPDDASKAEVLERAKALAERAPQALQQIAAAEQAASKQAAVLRAVEHERRAATRKFRTLGALGRRRAATKVPARHADACAEGATYRGEESDGSDDEEWTLSDDDEEDESGDARPRPPSFRQDFRSRGRRQMESGHGGTPEGHAEERPLLDEIRLAWDELGEILHSQLHRCIGAPTGTAVSPQ